MVEEETKTEKGLQRKGFLTDKQKQDGCEIPLATLPCTSMATIWPPCPPAEDVRAEREWGGVDPVGRREKTHFSRQ